MTIIMVFKDFLTIFIPSIISILGFIITFVINQKGYEQSIQKFKTEQQISDLCGLQNDVIDYVHALCKVIESPQNDNKRFHQLREKINLKVICFGSDDAVKLVLYIRNLVFSGVDDGIAVSNGQLIAAYIILAMQIKYDTTGIKTSPKSWYIGIYTSQKMLATGFYMDSVKSINNIVDELKLPDFLKVKP